MVAVAARAAEPGRLVGRDEEGARLSDFENIVGGIDVGGFDLPTDVFDPEIDQPNLVANDVGMPLHGLTLRPGSHRRVSFRATPGTSVEVGLRAHEWLPLDILDAPRAGSAGGASTDPAEPPVVAPLAMEAGFVDGGIATLASEVAARLARPRLGGGLGVGGIFDGGVFDPLDPLPPEPPVDPPPRPTVPIEVVVSERDGAELGRRTLRAEASSPSPAHFGVNDIRGNAVIDVTFINPNDVPAICTSCTVFAERRVRQTLTRMRMAPFRRAFNGAIASLNPTITVSNGKVHVSLEGELAHELGLHGLSTDVPESFEGGAKFEATDIEIMGQGQLVRRVIRLFRDHVSRNLLTGIPSFERGGLARRRRSHVLVDRFIDEVADAYFDERVLVSDAVVELVTPDDASKQLRGLLRARVDRWLEDFPLLTDPHEHRSVDPAFAASYALTGIHGELGPVSLEVEEIRLSLYLAFNHTAKKIATPFGDLPLDRLTVGAVRPALHVDLDISDFDIDIEVPLWLTVVSGGIVNLGAFLVEQGLEELADYLAGKAERQVPGAVHRLVAEHAVDYGDVIAATLEQIADRDHHFRRSFAIAGQFIISTIDPNQLRVPHDASAGVKPSPVAGVDDEVAPVLPIDHNPLASISVGPSPEELLNRIDHFVFVMMENRSFDHMLGYLSHPDFSDRGDVDGLDGSSRDLGGDLSGTRATPRPGPFPGFFPNLPHDHDSIVRQINDGRMNGFASEYARKLARTRGVIPEGLLNDPERALRFEMPDIVETYARLAREYTICDRWFASVPAGTYPNRACYYTGITPSLTNGGIADEFGYLDDLTLFDLLDHVRVEWRIFESDITFLRVFDRFRLEQDRIQLIGGPDDLPDPLPSVSFIDPNFTGFPSARANNDDQPPTDVRRGQEFVDGVVRRIEQSSHWDSTLLVIMYDEHGGFADHVAPPGAPGSSHPPGGPTQISFSHPDAHTYGVRVPAFVVSPFVRAGGVSHLIFDHAAVFRTLLQRFAPQHVNSKILPERVRRSRHLGEVLTDQPPRVATDTVARPQVLAASAPRRGRLTFDKQVDPESGVAVLRSIGVPAR